VRPLLLPLHLSIKYPPIVNDNRAISHASRFAKFKGVPLIVFFVFSPQDYTAHDRGARRIDFTLRNLKFIQAQLDKLGVPLFTLSHSPRRTLPQKILELLEQWDAKYLFANAGSLGCHAHFLRYPLICYTRI